MVYRFFHCRLDTNRRILLRNGDMVVLQPQAFRVLVYLLVNRHRLVPKHELFDKLWPHRVVGDAALNTCIKSIRRAIGDNGRMQRCIKTYHRQGYRFTAAVVEELPQSPEDAQPLTDAGAEHFRETHHDNGDTAIVVESIVAAPFIGRQHEMDMLIDRLRYAREGRGQVVNIIGEAGVGKTRMLKELNSIIEGMQQVRCYQCRSDNLEDSQTLTLAWQLIDQMASAHDSDFPNTEESITAQSDRTGRDQGDTAAVSGSGVVDAGYPAENNVNGKDDASELMQFLRYCLPQSQELETNVLMMDDTHWVDADAEQLLNQLVASVVNKPALLIFSYRPTYQSPWGMLPEVSQITLPGLTRNDSHAFLKAIMKRTTLSEELAEEIVTKAEGNPFFLEAYATTFTE